MNLHNEIMNIPTGSEMPEENPARTVYKLGHRDARHKAAEIGMEADRLINSLGEALENANAAFNSPIAKRRMSDDDEYIRQARIEMEECLNLFKEYLEK